MTYCVRGMPTRVTYSIFDQFGERITTSDFGDKHVQIREDVPWSGIRNAPSWARSNVRTAPNWVDCDRDRFTNGLNIPAFPTTQIIDPATAGTRTPKFNISPGTEVLAVRLHVWHTSVSGKVDTSVTENLLSVRVVAHEDRGSYDRIKLECTYTLKVTRKR